MSASRCLIAGVAIALLGLATQASARSDYNRTFWAVYQQELGKYAETTKCNVCHYGNDKKDRNDYGQAVGRALGGTDGKDADKIKAALQAAAKESSSTKGKSFGELIQAGKLPGKRPD